MATFTNYATLSYSGGITNSNTVTGELVEVLSVSKVAIGNDYTADDDITYVVSLVNSSSTDLTNVTATDDLGGYAFNATTLYPLEYNSGSLRYYVNGVLQATPTVTEGTPLVISGLTVPANGNATLIYEASVTAYAPLGIEASITNTVTVNGTGIGTALTATETVNIENRADLSISKALCPATVAENGRLTYTFVIQNFGSVEADADDEIIFSDTFDPVLSSLDVTFDGTAWAEGTNYNYDNTTGVFTTVQGQITVPAATYTQNTDGTWTVTPGTSTLIISGNITNTTANE